MEHYNSESHTSDEDSHETASSDDRPVRHAGVPAIALHGVLQSGHEAPPRQVVAGQHLESLLASEHHRRQEMAMQFHAEEQKHDAKEDKEDEDDDDEDVTTPSAQPTAPSAQISSIPIVETHDIPLPRTSEENNEVSEPLEEELSDEEVDDRFNQIVEVDLQDLQREFQDIALPSEPEALDPPVAEAGAAEAAYDIPAQAVKPSHESYTAPAAVHPSAWEGRAAQQPPEPSPRPEAMPPSDASLPEIPAERPPEPPMPDNGGGGNMPPTPPGGPSMEMPQPTPEPESQFNMLPQAMQPGFLDQLARPLGSARQADIENRLAYVEARGRRGEAVDTFVGLVAGWALLRTFRNRHKIKKNARETKKQFAEQQHTITTLTQQNEQLQQRATRVERQTAVHEQALANTASATPAERLIPQPRPAGEARPQRVAATAEAVAQAAAAEQVRLAHEQREAEVRRQTLEIPPDHEVVRSGWHSIEIDKNTGKVVEQPTGFEYGEAFQRERRSEQLQDKPQGAEVPQALAAGFFAGAHQQNTQQYSGVQVSASQTQNTTLPRPEPINAGSQKTTAKTASKQLTSAFVNPLFWAAIVFLLLVFFGAALL